MSVSSLLNKAVALTATLSQSTTNGGNSIGTFQAKHLPQFLTNNPITNSYPWGTKGASNSDPYMDAPNTGVVRSYDFTIARGTVAPDGFEKTTLLINGQFPGPMIEANWGDTIQVTVNNKIENPEEGTTLHWHGLMQQNSQWEDGVPAVSQCPIAPGASFTYSFKATPHGSTWYHSHYSSQYAGGLWGPLIIYGPETSSHDMDVGPVLLTDYFHRDYFDIVKDIEGTDLRLARPASDNNLINGRMNFDCSSNTLGGACTDNAGISKFNFTSGKSHRLRLINAGVQGIQKFSIDNHTMTVIANDFIQVNPYNVTVVTLGVGQRTDVIVQGTGHSGDVYWMRSLLAQGACTEPANQPLALAAIYYQNANTSASPNPKTSIAQTDTTDPCTNDGMAIPAYRIPVADPSTTINMAVNVSVNATGHLIWTVNESSFRGNYNNPLLLLAKNGNDSYPFDPQWNVYNVGSNQTIRVVVENQSPTSHPWHLHGHEMQVLSSGDGPWDGSITNANNPQRRDVQILPAYGHNVFQWSSDNPGVWPFHCHIAWHISGGLYANILERPNDIKNLAIPSSSSDLCKSWTTYTGANVVDQIDSGLKVRGVADGPKLVDLDIAGMKKREHARQGTV